MLAKKYRLTFQPVEWSDEEFDELGPLLRRRIRKMLALRMRRQERYEYAKAMHSLLDSEELIELL
jgi:hypothetical protein